MSCLRDILPITFLYFVLNSQFSFFGTTPLIGSAVRMAYLGESPFVVSLSKNNCKHSEKEELNHSCGGALVSRSHVLTAAHCLKSKPSYNYYVVKIGSIDLRNAEVYRIKWWITYNEWANDPIPDERYNMLVHDIAVVKLFERVSSDIPLPTISFIPDKNLYGNYAVTAGWGLIEDNKQPRYLRVVKLFIKHPEKCEFFNNHTNVLKEMLPKLYLCTVGIPPARIACGDSGSPLFIGNNIVGVNKAYCPKKGNLPLDSYQNVHSSVYAYKDFIETMMKK